MIEIHGSEWMEDEWKCFSSCPEWLLSPHNLKVGLIWLECEDNISSPSSTCNSWFVIRRPWLPETFCSEVFQNFRQSFRVDPWVVEYTNTASFRNFPTHDSSHLTRTDVSSLAVAGGPQLAPPSGAARDYGACARAAGRFRLFLGPPSYVFHVFSVFFCIFCFLGFVMFM
jgi:hypothetical protein